MVGHFFLVLHHHTYYVRDCTERTCKAEGSHKYETEKQLQEYLALHYGAPEIQMRQEALPAAFATALENFPRRCADKLIEAALKAGVEGSSALDVGCAVGASTFALARHFENVVGIDFSASFIKAAEALR